jgi:hypothetical protein
VALNIAASVCWQILRSGAVAAAFSLSACAPQDTQRPATASPEIGLLALEPTSYELNGTQLNAAAARLFYSYLPATTDDDSAPLFVLTGGGPAASMLFLLGFAGPYKLDGVSSPSLVENADDWSSLAHLLFIDARNSGLSHGVHPNVANELERRAAFSADNYNVYQDAADVLSALLSFLEAKPALAQRKVYFVAQSYGGLRASVMLHFLLDHAAYANRERNYYSERLSAQIGRFFAEQFEQVPTKTQIAERFRGQILLQPVLAGARQDQQTGRLFEEPGSIVEQLAVEQNVTYVRCAAKPPPCDALANAHQLLEQLNRSRYDARTDTKWLDRHLAFVSEGANAPHTLAALLNTTEQELSTVLRQARTGAYRFGAPSFANTAPRGNLEAAFGSLEPWDSYFLALNYEALNAFSSTQVEAMQAHRNADIFGSLFLHNARYVNTMVTRARHDLQIYGKALPFALASYPELKSVNELTAPERLLLEYADGSQRTLFTPTYAQSSHAVARDEPTQLKADVQRFLAVE